MPLLSLELIIVQWFAGKRKKKKKKLDVYLVSIFTCSSQEILC